MKFYLGAKRDLGKIKKKIETSFFSGLVLFILLVVPSNAQDLTRVREVVDGDTLVLTNGEKIRLIGIRLESLRSDIGKERKSKMRKQEEYFMPPLVISVLIGIVLPLALGVTVVRYELGDSRRRG